MSLPSAPGETNRVFLPPPIKEDDNQGMNNTFNRSTINAFASPPIPPPAPIPIAPFESRASIPPPPPPATNKPRMFEKTTIITNSLDFDDNLQSPEAQVFCYQNSFGCYPAFTNYMQVLH